LKGLKSLILLETTLISLSSLAHLSLRIPQLEHLRFSLELSILASADKGTQLSGKDEEDRGVLLVLFQELVMLNGNEIRPKEREEAERRFCSRHTTSPPSSLRDISKETRLTVLSSRSSRKDLAPLKNDQ
jgi:hypothetical protein